MQQYLDLVRHVLTHGTWVENRTGIRTCKVPGAYMRFDLAEGFPAITTKKVAFKSAIGELTGFIRGVSTAKDFRDLGTRVWDANANDSQAWLANPYREGTDSLGPIYGVQWRGWEAYKVLKVDDSAKIADATTRGYKGLAYFDHPQTGEAVGLFHKKIDQLRECLDTIVKNPDDRRILFHGWNPAQIEEMALPPCHVLYQFYPNSVLRELSIGVYIRSQDIGLGMPFNVLETAALLAFVARLTGFRPRVVSYTIGDAHVYENHVPMLEEQLLRKPYPLPRLVISDRIPDYAKTGVYAPEWLEHVESTDFALEGYQHHPPLTAPMAV